MTNESSARPVEELLQRGLDLYGRNLVDEAVQCWQQVLTLMPGERRALDYLESAGFAPATPPAPVARDTEPRPARASRPPSAPMPGPELAPPGVDHDALVELLRDRRFEDALQLLYRQREQHPGDAAITRSIRHLKDHLTVLYGRELGTFDGVPLVAAPDEIRLQLSVQERQILRLIDGIATYGDIVVGSQLGRFETCRTLAHLLRRGIIVTRKPSGLHAAVQLPPVAPSWTDVTPPPTRRSYRPERLDTPVEATPAPASVRFDAAVSGPQFAVAAPQVAGDPPPPSSVVPARSGPLSQATADPHAALFRGATEAYVRRDYDEALRLFEECVRLRPSDARAAYNLRKLRERKGTS